MRCLIPSSTMSHLEHKEQKETIMKNLAKKIDTLTADEYDKEIFTNEEIAAALNKEDGVMLAVQFDVDVSVLGSEIIHVKDEIENLRNEKVSFRNENKNVEKIVRLENFERELFDLFTRKLNFAMRLKNEADRKKRFEESVKALTPIYEDLKKVSKQLTEKRDTVREVKLSTLPNHFDPDIFTLMVNIAKA